MFRYQKFSETQFRNNSQKCLLIVICSESGRWIDDCAEHFQVFASCFDFFCRGAANAQKRQSCCFMTLLYLRKS